MIIAVCGFIVVIRALFVFDFTFLVLVGLRSCFRFLGIYVNIDFVFFF